MDYPAEESHDCEDQHADATDKEHDQKRGNQVNGQGHLDQPIPSMCHGGLAVFPQVPGEHR
jgi:hypothetical protein